MPATYNYNVRFREQILKELEEGVTIEGLSQKYNVPISVIDEWKRQADADISAAFSQETSNVDRSWFGQIRNFFSTITITPLKGKLLAGALAMGLLTTIGVAVLFYGKAEFKPEMKPEIELTPKIDSLVLYESKIEKKFDEQIKLSQSIKESMNMKNIINSVTFNVSSQRSQKKRNVKQVAAHKTSCCKCCKCPKDSIQ